MITQKIIARTDSLKLDKIISRYGEDSMRHVVFIIVRPDPESEELIPITIPEDAVGSFRILKPSGNFVIVPMSKSVLATGETAFDVVLPASANTAKGSGYYDIRITSETDKYYFTAQGDFLIDDNIISDEVLEDVSEVNGLIFPDDFLTVEDHVAIIDDDTISTDSTWSSNKINEEIEAHAGGDVSKTVSGNPVTFTDGASAPLVKCVTEIQGSQDLHGYDKPWVGGAGKNKAVLTVDSIKAKNTAGTWTGNSYNFTGVIYVLETDDGNIVGISAGGATGAYPALFIAIDTVVGTKYKVWKNGYRYRIYKDGTQINDSSTDYTFTAESGVYTMTPFVGSGTISERVYYPLVTLSSETDGTFEPYSNICPITAYTEGEIEVSDGDGNTTSHTTTFPSAIYRGSEDVVNGEVTSTWGSYTFTGSEGWTKHGSVDKYYSNKYLVAETAKLPATNTNAVQLDTPIGIFTEPYTGLESKTYSMSISRDGRIGITADIYANISMLTGMTIWFELATPTTSSVTPTNLPIKSLLGYNHIESSTGDMEVEYITERFQPLIDSIKQL